MIKRLLIGLVCAIGGVVAIVLLAGGVMAWRLSAGPVSLGPLTPIVELALNALSGPMQVSVEDAVLAWERSDGVLRARLLDIRADSRDDEMALSVPVLSLGLSTGALLGGAVVPTEIEAVRPHLTVVRQDGERSAAATPGADIGDPEAPLLAVMSTLADWVGPDREAPGLRQIVVERGSLRVEDRETGLSWQGDLANTRVWRDDEGLNATGFLAATSGGQQSDVALAAEYDATKRRLAAGFSLGRIRPAMFAPLASSLAGLAAIDLPIRGTLALAAGGGGEIEKTIVDLSGETGHLALPAELARELGVADAAQRLATRAVEFKGQYEAEGEAIGVERLSIDLEPGQTVNLPAPIDHRMPLSAVRAQGRYRGVDNSARLVSLEVDLDGPSIAVTGTAEGIGTADGLKATAEIVAKDIKTNDFPRYWPSSLGPNAYDWVTERLSEGGISEARVALTATESADGIDIASLSGEMDINGVSVDYLPPMPKAQNASGVGVFDLNSLTVTITGAESAGVSVRGGTARLFDFDKSLERADIDLSIEGPVRKVLELIDHQPLGYVEAMGLSPSQASGFSSGRLRLQFPLLEDLPLDKLKISADAKLDNLAVTDAVLGADITNGRLTVKLDETGMDANGRLVIAKTPATVVWRENFETGAPFDSRIDVAVASADVGLLRNLRIEAAPLIEQHIEGPVGIDLNYVSYPNGEDTVTVKTDAKRAALDVPYVGWKKARGTPATGAVAVKLRNGRLTEIPNLAFESKGLDVQASVRFDPTGDLEKVLLSRLAIGRTDMEATLSALRDGGWAVDAEGKGFNAGPLINTLGESDATDEPMSLGPSPLSITAKFDTVWIDENHPLKKVAATIVRDDDVWSHVRFNARVGRNAPLSAIIAPESKQSRSLKITSSDAGSTLRALGLSDDMIGGKLRINGTFNDAVAGAPLNGTVKVSDYRITDAPLMAKVLSVMALTGILDQLGGKGIGFAILNAPFTLHNGVLELSNARASGTELGMTAEGRLANDTLNLKGTIVPFYAVNSLLGKIPIVGSLFSGGDRGGGLLAARYSITGPMNDPKVTVNPLSMLAPGFLRNLFDIFESDSGTGGGRGGAGSAPMSVPTPDNP